MNIGMYNAVSGLQTAARQLDVASHNVANADTPGYSRQRADQVANQPQPHGAYGQIGTGVSISQITRVRDQFIDKQVHRETSPLGEATVKSEALRQLEDIYAEPSENGLSAQMTRYFDSWHDLTANPENIALRTNLRQNGVNLAEAVKETANQLSLMKRQLNDQIETTVGEINSLSKQIASLNSQIQTVLAAGQSPNDLKDTQDRLIEELSLKVKISAVEQASTGATNIYLAGQPLVVAGNQYDLNPVPLFANGITDIQYGPTGLTAPITGGELKGLLDMRDIALGDNDPRSFIYQLNDLAVSLMTTVNAQHSIGFGLTGVTGQNFFEGTSAFDMEVNPNIVNDTALANGLDVIAAAADDPNSINGGVGDNAIAIAIAQLRNQTLMNGLSATFQDAFKGTLASLGTQAAQANRTVTTQGILLDSVKERRDQVSGVSTDEEMANVMRFQKAYAASARILSTIDEMLETLINIGR